MLKIILIFLNFLYFCSVDQNLNSIIADILSNIFGHPKDERPIFDQSKKQQIEFNCPTLTCKHDVNKFNLSYNLSTKIFNCWKCHYSGFVLKLVKDYGSSRDYNNLKLLLPYKSQGKINIFRKPEIDHNLMICDLPEGFSNLNQRKNSNLYKTAYDYVTKDRKITPEQIDFYNIGYTEIGKRRNRIIIPSLNLHKKINYFEARAFLKNNKIPYLKPDYPDKNNIIFNELLINWDLPIYLVEGFFDAIRLPNAIPLLGKTIPELLMEKILLYKPIVILCLDTDAIKDSLDVYKSLNYMGINVYYVDLNGYKDISKIYEDYGQEVLLGLIRNKKRVDFQLEIKKKVMYE